MHNLEEYRPKRRGVSLEGCMFRHIGGGSSTDSQTKSSTQVADSRVAAADQGVVAQSGGSVDQSQNDNRNFADYSQLFTTDNSTKIVNTSDPAIVQASLDAATSASNNAAAVQLAGIKAQTEQAKQSSDLYAAALDFGSQVAGQSYGATQKATDAAFGAVGDAQAHAYDFAGTLVTKAIDAVTQSASADRAFSQQTAQNVTTAAQSSDQQNTQKIITAGVYIAALIAGAFAVKAVFGRKSA